MSSVKELENDIAAKTRAIAPLAQRYMNGGLEGDDLSTFRTLHSELEILTGKKIDAERTEEEQRSDMVAAQRALAANRHYNEPAGRRASGIVPRGETNGSSDEHGSPADASIGERFIDSEQFTSYRTQGVGQGSRSRPFVVGSLYRGHAHELERRKAPDEQRALITSTVITETIAPLRVPGIFAPDLRELRVRDILTNGRTTGNTIEWVKELARTNAAAEVAEATTLTTTGLKPESGFTLATDSTTVRTIATLIYITRPALDDNDQMRTYIDSLLRRFVEEREDKQLLIGDGTAPNLRGLMNMTGRLVLNGAYFTTTVPGKLDRLRRAKTRMRIASRGKATAFVLNPENVEEFEVMKTNTTAGNNEYAGLGGGPFGGAAGGTIWGVPYVESEDMPVNKALAVDGRYNVVFDRMDAQVYITDSNRDLFERNILTLLCESRLALASYRPETIVEIDLVATI